MNVKQLFQNCPECRSALQYSENKKYLCRGCGWEFYRNPAAAVAVLLELEGKVAVIRREREPGQGLLDLPGGFVDPGEGAEEAARREVLEELGIKLGRLEYFCSGYNLYTFQGIEYATCDIIYTAALPCEALTVDRSEIQELLLLRPEELDPAAFAFRSLAEAVDVYRQKQRGAIF